MNLWCGDCLELMQNIPDQSIDMILCDLPYGITRNKWDAVIDPDKLWKQYNRIIKSNGAILLFGQDKFTAKMMLSNEKMHRYNLIWDKQLKSGFLNANRQPLRQHEDIMVFYKSQPTYNPQKVKGVPCHSKGTIIGKSPKNNNNYGDYSSVQTVGDMKYPSSILSFQKPPPSMRIHPTEKPVDLLEYLIKTYTNEGEVVLDNCMGTGNTGIACLNTNRDFIGIELDENYFEIAQDKIEKRMEELNGD
jgi:DNA modification methylase